MPRPFLRILFIFIIGFYSLHFLSSLSSSSSYGGTDYTSISDHLDHYADFESGVRGRLSNGVAKLKDGLSTFKGGLGWGGRGVKLGSLYSLISTSNLDGGTPYYDHRTSLNRIRLTSTRVLGHGPTDPDSLSPVDPSIDSIESESLQRGRGRQHILVTGGFGSLGKHVIRDLLLGLTSGERGVIVDGDEEMQSMTGEENVFITLLDTTDRTSELDYLLQSAPLNAPRKLKGTDPRASAFASSEKSVNKLRGRIRIIIGDVRDQNLIQTLVKPASVSSSPLSSFDKRAPPATRRPRPKLVEEVIPPITGIIHLAAYSPSDCRINPVDCESVEVGGMQMILNSLKREARKDVEGGEDIEYAADRPWVVIPRRMNSIYDDGGTSFQHNSSKSPIAKADDLLKDFATIQPIHAILLRLPPQRLIIGDIHSSRYDPVPHLVESALGHLPIVISANSNDAEEPYLDIEDVSRSIVQAARMLDLASKKSYVQRMAFVAEINLVGPAAVIANSGTTGLVQAIVSITRSESPVADYNKSASSVVEGKASTNILARSIATKALGTTPTTSVHASLRQYITTMLQRQSQHLASRISVACSSPPAVPVLEEGFHALSGCDVQLLTAIEGSYYTLGCSAGIEEPHLTPVALLNAVPFKEGVRMVALKAERGFEGRIDIQIRCPIIGLDGTPTGGMDAVVWTENQAGGSFAGASTPGTRAISEWYTLEFTQRETRSFPIALPPTEGVDAGQERKRRLMLKDTSGSSNELHFQSVGTPLLWRVNPICCPEPSKRTDLWDFYKEDPVITSQVTYPSDDGRTTPLESTLSVRRCRDLRFQNDAIVALQKSLAGPKAKVMCRPKRTGDVGLWSAKDRSICSIDCTAPIVCLASSSCKCTRDRCGSRKPRGPFPALAYTNSTSFTTATLPPVSKLDLTELVDSIPWNAIILPGAKAAFDTPIEAMPKAHVVLLPTTIDTHLNTEACFNLAKSPTPFLADHFLVEALRNQSVAIEQADFVMVPYYQGCYYNYQQENTFKKLAETISFAEQTVITAPEITASKVVVPFSHDFGSCTGWWPRLEDLLGRAPPSPMDKAIAWQVNGDYNTRCVKPDQDVIIPAVTKHTKALIETYGLIASVTPSSERPHLAFFAGGIRGFGAIARTRIGCGKGEGTTSRILYQKFAAGERYLGTLNSAKFCLLPRGIPSWTTRTFEAIYAGCIPTFIADRNLFPFQDILDYSLFSITIPESQAHQVEEILATIDDERIRLLQAHVLRVREAFIYKEGEEWERKGPLFFSLVAMKMRLELEYGGCAVKESKR